MLMGWGGPAGRLLVTQAWEWWRCQRMLLPSGRNLEKMEQRSEGNLMKFNEEKCKVLAPGRNNPM